MGERADKPQTDLVQTVWQMHKVKFGVLGVGGGTSGINDKTLDRPFRQVLKTSQRVRKYQKEKAALRKRARRREKSVRRPQTQISCDAPSPQHRKPARTESPTRPRSNFQRRVLLRAGTQIWSECEERRAGEKAAATLSPLAEPRR